MTLRVQTFMGKVSVDALQQMDTHINKWLADHPVSVKTITQSYGYERPREGAAQEPVIVTSVWYEEERR